MHRFLASAMTLGLMAGPCFAEPNDIAARSLAQANMPDCSPPTSLKPHIAEWRHDIRGSGEDATLWGFPCDSGAYNTLWSVILWSQGSGHRIASLPVPLYSSAEGGDGFTVTGMVADTRIWGQAMILKAVYFVPPVLSVPAMTLPR